MKIVFMGTPGFAVGILKTLVEAGENIVAVITAPDKPAGRGKLMHESEVKKYALAQNLRLLQPEKLKDETFIEDLKSLEADLFVVVAFRMLPEIIWAMPPKGTINLHASLLPQYRGAAPINWVLINGERQTGVSTFFIEKEIDTGKVIDRAELSISDMETAGELHDRLMESGAQLMLKTVQQIASGLAQAIDQEQLNPGTQLKEAPKIFKEDCRINWQQNVQQVHNHIRGLSPYPTAWTMLEDESGEAKSFKLFLTESTDIPVKDKRKLIIQKQEILIPCADYYIKVLEIQPEGKKRLEAQAFVAGYSKTSWKTS